MHLQRIMRVQAWLPILAALIVSVSLGCRPNKRSRSQELERESQRAQHVLENRIKENRDPRGLSKSALTRLHDGVQDHVPFLISVDLGCTDDNQPMLFLTCLNEGRNLRGIRIREERMGLNSETTALEERYPLYIAWPETDVLAVHMFHVELRDAGQQKDEDAWKDYAILALEDLVRKFIYNGPVNEVIKIPPSESVDRKMPPIRISLPETNRVRVSVSVYDREGHESDAAGVGISPRVYRRLKDAEQGH